jgi:LPS sulfotransferase NodH
VSVSPWGEKVRAFLVNRLFTPIYGIVLDDWLRLLRKHRVAVDLPYWPRAVLVTLISPLTSLLHRHENAKYGPKLAGVRVEQPLFVLGHARSGTTYLHSLLATDERFAYPNLWQALNPHTFLSTERYSGIIRLVFRLVAPKTRLVDNTSLDPDAPLEEEFATCSGTLHSPLLGWVFPRSRDHYERYLTFRGVPEEETARWKAALLLFYKKLTWKYGGRPLVLKSPFHTCRIRLLLEMFPDARFVHIHRDPYAVFQSAKRLDRFMSHSMGLQRPNPDDDVDSRIIHLYKEMYEVFFEEQGLIPEGRFHEVCYEELVRDPVGEVKRIYERLGIPGFGAAQGPLRRYVEAVGRYRKNEHSEIPLPLRRRIARAWKQNFDEWGYDHDELEERQYDYDQAGLVEVGST